MEENELIQKVNEYTLYLSDDYLDEVCEELLKLKDLNSFFAKCYQNVDFSGYNSPCPFICDSVTHIEIENQLFKNMKTIAFINFAKKCFMILHVTDEGTL